MSGLTTSSIGPQFKAPLTFNKKGKQDCFSSAKSSFALPKDNLKKTKPRAYRRLFQLQSQTTLEKGSAEFATERAKNIYQQFVGDEYLNLLKDQSATPMDVFSLEASLIGEPQKNLQETPLENCSQKMCLDED